MNSESVKNVKQGIFVLFRDSWHIQRKKGKRAPIKLPRLPLNKKQFNLTDV